MAHRLPISKDVQKADTVYASHYVLIAGILFVAFNLRPAITSVGPLVPIIRESTGMTNGVAGMLTAIPLMSFAVFSLVAPKLGMRYGNHVSIFVALIILGAGILIRSTETMIAIFTGTALVGVGIAICNVLLPAVVKFSFPQNIGLVTSLYTASMGMFASIGSAVSIPLSESLGLGWKIALAFWAFMVVMAIIAWLPQIKKDKEMKNSWKTDRRSDVSKTIWASPLAWYVTLFMGFQSFLFYSLITWTPDVLQELGLSLSTGGWMVFLLQFVGIPFSFAAPMIADKLDHQKLIVITICCLYFFGFAGLLIYPNTIVIVTSMIFLGIAQGAAISLALTFLSLRTTNVHHASMLSGMAQSFGYLLAAFGPILMGYFHDLFHTWRPLLVFLLIVSVFILIFGLKAGENRYIFQKK